MYSENQAIQKKRDNMQTSALEWIINHLKALQSNIISINNLLNSYQVKSFSFTVSFNNYYTIVAPSSYGVPDEDGAITDVTSSSIETSKGEGYDINYYPSMNIIAKLSDADSTQIRAIASKSNVLYLKMSNDADLVRHYIPLAHRHVDAKDDVYLGFIYNTFMGGMTCIKVFTNYAFAPGQENTIITEFVNVAGLKKLYDTTSFIGRTFEFTIYYNEMPGLS